MGKSSFSKGRKKEIWSVMSGGAGVKIGTPIFSIGGLVDCACACVYLYPHMYYFEKFSVYNLVQVFIIMILIKIVLDILALF